MLTKGFLPFLAQDMSFESALVLNRGTVLREARPVAEEDESLRVLLHTQVSLLGKNLFSLQKIFNDNGAK